MCGPLHAHIEATTAVRVGCMGAEDKMAGDTHELRHWPLLHVPQHQPHQRQVCDEAREHAQARLSDADSHMHVWALAYAHIEATAAVHVGCMCE